MTELNPTHEEWKEHLKECHHCQFWARQRHCVGENEMTKQPPPLKKPERGSQMVIG